MEEIYIAFREIPPDNLLEKYNVAVDREHKSGFANDTRLFNDDEFMSYVKEHSEVEI